MGFKVNFTDNQNVTAEDLSTVSSDISGTETNFSDGIIYGVDSLNDISKAMITSGVSKGCDVTLVDDATVHISDGVAFFDDGKKVVVDAEGLDIPFEKSGKKQYVWFLNDALTGVVSAKITESDPTGDCIRLAEITSGGNVLKVNHCALMKNSSLLPNHYGNPITVDVRPPDGKNDYYDIEINIGDNYRKLVAISNYDILFMDWENMVAYNVGRPNGIVKRIIGGEENPAVLCIYPSVDAYVYFISLENNILKARIYHPGSVTHNFTLHLM